LCSDAGFASSDFCASAGLVALVKAMRAYDVEERSWKAKFDPVQAAVYAAINRKQPSR